MQVDTGGKTMGTKYFNNDEWIAGVDGISILSIDDLESVSGGREPRASEAHETTQMDMNVAHTVSGLIQTGKRTEASELTLRWMHAFQKWHEDVSNAPENGPDIHISDYFSLYER